ncbi:hypothetical protein [Parapedobacter tibetensis]|uniref:hypothetical protein n=1 Tax=Parapedobacter tibetensis TaxID=2972951 RepID=UPI00214DBC3E|nr:hypothetical protein [Parapedobacter tibetensis]
MAGHGQCSLYPFVNLLDAIKNAVAQFEKKHGSAYVVKVSKNGKESKTLNPKLKTLLRGIVEQYGKDGTLPK